MRSIAVCALLAALPLACATEPPPPPPAPPKSEALAKWEMVKGVLQSPRCVNCHPTGDRPTQGDDMHVHLQNVQRGPEGKGAVGLGCTTCHGASNLPATYGKEMPPGVSTGWQMPPPDMKMVFQGMGSRALCEQLKDPARNGHKDMAALIEHMSSPLVLWGWAPGTARKPVAVPHAEFVAAFKSWAQDGAPCPAAD